MSTWVSRASLEELIGSEAAEVLCGDYGGIPFYIPRKVRPGEGLAAKIGFGRAYALCKAYGGDYIALPLGRPESLKVQIVKAIKEGKNASEIARELRTTERYVRRIMSERRKASTWLTLI